MICGTRMPIHLDQVVPWGRSFDEYVRMFDLDDPTLSGRILGVGDGPASFNAELTASARSGTVVSIDPIYLFPGDAIRGRVQATYANMLAQVRRYPEEFVWTYIRDPDDLGRRRLAAMERFLADYEAGKRDGRYVAGSLPDLPFADGAFDLAVCSHLLFLYAQHLSLEFHLRSIEDACRVAAEVRIFPLLMLGSKPSPHVPPVMETLRGKGYSVEVRKVAYEFQRGGNEMMVVKKNTARERAG